RLAIRLHRRRVHVRVNAKVAELAPLAAKWNVQIQTERHIPRGRGHRALDFGYIFGAPLRKRRIVRNEITANFSLRRFGGHAHFFGWRGKNSATWQRKPGRISGNSNISASFSVMGGLSA